MVLSRLTRDTLISAVAKSIVSATYVHVSNAERCEGKSSLIPVALKCLCELLAQKSQFNFSVDIMDVVCKHVGRPDWDEVCAAYESRDRALT